MRIKDAKDKLMDKFLEIDLIEEVHWNYKTLETFPCVVIKYRGVDTELRTTWRWFREEHKFEANVFIQYQSDELSEEFFVEVSEKILDKLYEDDSQTLWWLANLLVINNINDSLEDEEQKVKIITVDLSVIFR